MSQQSHLPRHWSLPGGRAYSVIGSSAVEVDYSPFWSTSPALGSCFLRRILLDFSFPTKTSSLPCCCFVKISLWQQGLEEEAEDQHVIPAGLACRKESHCHYNPSYQDTLKSLSFRDTYFHFSLPFSISEVSNIFSSRGDFAGTHLIQYWAPWIHLQVCCFYFKTEEGPKTRPLFSDSYCFRQDMLSLSHLEFFSQDNWHSLNHFQGAQ